MLRIFLSKLINKCFDSKFGITLTGLIQAMSLFWTSQFKEILWIGDSHASFISGIKLSQLFGNKSNTSLVWLGPRLMYSISKKGFPFYVHLSLKLSRRNTNVIFVLGEIDVRVHLVARNDYQFDFAKDYIDLIASFKEKYKGLNFLVVSPLPPSDLGAQDEKLPRNGSLAQRIQTNAALTSKLKDLCFHHNVQFLDITELICAKDGSLAPKFTLDGCHCNHVGSAKIKEKISTLLG